MSFFDFASLEKQGRTDTDTRFDNIDEAHDRLLDLVGDLSRSVRIYTPDLEPLLLDNENLISRLVDLSRGNRHARIQILCQNTSFAVQRGHRLLRLAQTLTSAMQIRVPPVEYAEDSVAFVVGDMNQVFFRTNTSTYQGIYNADCKVRAQKLDDLFTLIWEQSQTDPETQNLHI